MNERMNVCIYVLVPVEYDGQLLRRLWIHERSKHELQTSGLRKGIPTSMLQTPVR